LYKTLFATNFVGNTYKFYNFVENYYPRKNYLSIKILRKNGRKKYFLANNFNKFARKISCNIRISNRVSFYILDFVIWNVNFMFYTTQFV